MNEIEEIYSPPNRGTKILHFQVSKKKNPLFVCGWDRKSVRVLSVCHRYGSLVMPIGDPRDGLLS